MSLDHVDDVHGRIIAHRSIERQLTAHLSRRRTEVAERFTFSAPRTVLECWRLLDARGYARPTGAWTPEEAARYVRDLALTEACQRDPEWLGLFGARAANRREMRAALAELHDHSVPPSLQETP